MEEEQIWTIFFCFWLAVFGAVLGSFLDCAVSRWALGERGFLKGRSRCASCGHTLGAGDLIPVFSFLFRRGRCKYCGERIPGDCLAAELAGALALGCVGYRFGPSPELGQWAVLAALLLVLSLADRARRIIPDRLLLLAAVNRAVWFVILGQGKGELLTALLSCALPAALLALILGMEKLLGRELMGGGDIKLLFVLALYLSWAELLMMLFLGCLSGLIWAVFTRHKAGKALPFGPFLAAGALITVCFGGPVLIWYLSLF